MSLILDALKKAEEQKAALIESSSLHAEENLASTSTITETAAPPVEQMPLGPASVPNLGIKQSNGKRNPYIMFALVGIALGVAVSLGLKQYKSYMSASEVVVPKSKNFAVQQSSPEIAKPEVDADKIAKMKKQATTKFELGRYQESSAVYAELTQLAPLDPEVFNNYGVVLKRLEKLEDAKAAYLQALALTSDNYPEALNNLAVLYIGQSNYRDARARLEKALELNPEYVDVHLHLGLCLEKMGHSDKAVEHYEKFLNLSYGRFDRKIRLQVEGRIARLSGV